MEEPPLCMECIDPNELNTHFIYVMNGIIIVVALVFMVGSFGILAWHGDSV